MQLTGAVSIPDPPSSVYHTPLEAGTDFAKNLEPIIIGILKSLDCHLTSHLNAGLLFEHCNFASRIIIDVGICRQADLEYIDYTREQNELMTQCPQTLRFDVESPDDVRDLAEEIEYFLLEKESDKPFPPHKRGRDESHPDPTKPEDRFENLFREGFGESAMHALRREHPFIDFEKSTRYIDYALLTPELLT